jgi:hypothetical protein
MAAAESHGTRQPANSLTPRRGANLPLFPNRLDTGSDYAATL